MIYKQKRNRQLQTELTEACQGRSYDNPSAREVGTKKTKYSLIEFI